MTLQSASIKPGFSSAYTTLVSIDPSRRDPVETVVFGVPKTQRQTHMLEVELGLLANCSIAVERALDTIAEDLGVHLRLVGGYMCMGAAV